MATDKRDNFSPKVSEILKKRAAFICSSPECKIMTIAPSITDEEKFQYIGVCAHITAAKEGGPRFDKSLTNQQRADSKNGIFLCNNCATKIDKNNGADYSYDLLNEWKIEHENWILKNLNKSIKENPTNTLQVNSINQLGGITANIVNISAESTSPIIDKSVDHDVNLFSKADGILTENLLTNVLNRLLGDESIMSDNLEKIEDFLDFYKLSANIFLHDNLEKQKIELFEKLKILNCFLGEDFDMWPYDQNSENFRICMNPMVNVDRGGDFSIESDIEHTRLKRLLFEYCQNVELAYSNFRKEIKKTLFV